MITSILPSPSISPIETLAAFPPVAKSTFVAKLTSALLLVLLYIEKVRALSLAVTKSSFPSPFISPRVIPLTPPEVGISKDASKLTEPLVLVFFNSEIELAP